MRLTRLLAELERLQKEANTDPLQLHEPALRPPRQSAAAQQQQSAAAVGDVEHSCTDPNVVHSCRWTEHTERGGASRGSSSMQSITGKLEQWTTGSGEEPKETGSDAVGTGAEKEGGGGLGGALSGMRERLGLAGEKMSEAASGLHDKVSETFGDFKSKPFIR